jgi:phosphopantetheinyl transferase (holo-ACP synthase)
MIGNDVVDLHLVLKNGHPDLHRWREKVFTDEEIALIEVDSEPQELAWRMWSMKESAYKAHMRSAHLYHVTDMNNHGSFMPKRSLRPKRLVCSISSKRIGSVKVDGREYHTTSESFGKTVYSQATADRSVLIRSKLFRLDGTDRQSIHHSIEQLFLKRYRQTLGEQSMALTIVKNEIGLPLLLIDGYESPLSFSFSFHGAYGAYAFQELHGPE